MVIELRRLVHADINLLRELRNANADAFFDSHYITVEDQENWWYEVRFKSEVQFYTIWINGVTPVGFLSVKPLGAVYGGESIFSVREVGSLLLAPAYRGQGIMHAAITEVRRLYNPLTFWVAHVKPTNTASLAVFARQQFVQLDGNMVVESKKSTKSRRANAHSASGLH